MKKKYGYIRVSTKDQNPERQYQAMGKMGVYKKNIYEDKMSGYSFSRPAYKKMIKRMKSNDVLVIKSIDRLGRNYSEILEQWRMLTKEKKIDIQVIDMPLLNTDSENEGLTGTFISDLVLQILAYVAETERSFIKQRQAEGIPMLNVGNAVQKAATDKALREGKWRIESNGTKVYSFQKNGAVFDVTKKEYGFSDETEAIGNYENKNGIIEFEIEGKKRQFQYGKKSSIKDSVLVSDGNNWFNEDLFEKYKNEDIFYESNPEDGQYPIIMMPFQDKVKKSDTKIKEKLTSAYWKYMERIQFWKNFVRMDR